jgi:hypothetical protein
MITVRTVEVYGYISLAIMILLLVLVWLKQVPDGLIVPLFLVAVALFVGRIVLRIIVARQKKSGPLDGSPR